MPENIPVLRMLEIFRKTPLHVAFVVDEYGDFLGLVTLTDVLERGRRANCRRSTIPALPHELLKRADGSWLVDGRAPVEEVAAKLRLRHRERRFPYRRGPRARPAGAHPGRGRGLRDRRLADRSLDMDGKRIDKLLFVPPDEPEAA